MEKNKIDELMDRLPSTIKANDILWPESKKVLAALLELYLHSEAKKTKVVICGNKLLRKLASIGKDKLLDATNQLQDYGLVTRLPGKKRVKGEKSKASQYNIHFDRLVKPLVKELTFEDLFSDELKTLETSNSPATITAIPTKTKTSIKTTTTTITATGTTTSIGETDVESKAAENDYSGTGLGGGVDNFFDKVFIDATDYKEDNSFLEDLEKRVCYAKWDKQIEEERGIEE